jgi:ubiquinone/menaquinone biosynthesis C-methylase UbiE
VSADERLDKWAAWIIHRRDGGDVAQRKKAAEHLLPIRDGLLDRASIQPGDIVLDVGAGDGLIAFGALEREPSSHVVVSDISTDLLMHTRELARDLDLEDRMTFVEARAEDLSQIRDASVDVVTVRSVLIYVEDKAAAFGEFYRVLEPGGRLSIFEPINNYFPDRTDEFWGFDAGPVKHLVAKVFAYEGWTEESAETDPMMNFNERDLLRYAEESGFREVHVDLKIDVEPGTWVVDWERLLDTAPNPNALTVREAMRGALTDDEFHRVEQHLRPLADAGQGVLRSAFAYVHGVK